MIKHTFIIFVFVNKLYKLFCIQNSMSQYYTNNQNSITFQKICLTHYERILEISTKEFTKGYWNFVTTGNIVNKVYQTDKTKEFSQSVLMLANALYPHFNSKMKERFKKYEEKKGEKIKDTIKLFRNLSSLLFDLDYLQSSTSVDDDDDDEGD